MARGDLVLVVEDDDSIRMLMQMALEDEGYSVLTAENGEIALTLAREHPPKLILLDLRMPVMDGWKFGQAYRANSPTAAPIIVLTAAADRLLNPADLPGDTYLVKPFDVHDLIALVAHYVNGGAPR